MYTIFITTMLFLMTSVIIMRAKEVYEEKCLSKKEEELL